MTKEPENLRGYVLAALVGYMEDHPLPMALSFTRDELGRLLDSFTVDELARAMERGKNDEPPF